MINSVGLYNLSQNTVSSVSIQTGLKAVGRPAFILADSDVDSSTKKYSATKELLYQVACLGLYFAVVPFFKNGAYSLAKKVFKEEPVFKLFEDAKSFKEFHGLSPEEKLKKLPKIVEEKKLDKKLNELAPKSEHLAKGVIEAGALAGSVIGLAIIAPIISHPLIHPILKVFGLENKKAKPADEVSVSKK